MITTLVPRKEITKIWPMVEPLIEGSLMTDRLGTIDVFSDLLLDKKALWVSFDAKGHIGVAAVTSICEMPNCRVMFIELLGGEEIEQWIDSAHAVMNAYAFDQGCKYMECRGRFGWKPRLKKLGWEATSMNYERAVSDPAKAKEAA